MPCDQINLLSVEFKARNRDLLKRAIEAIGWAAREIGSDIIQIAGRINTGTRIEINLETGIAQMRDRQDNRDLLNELKRSYSRTVVEEIARKKKWIARKKSPNEITLTRY